MEKVTIWYATDNDHGEKNIQAIDSLGLTVSRIDGLDLASVNIIQDEINIFIFDIISIGPKEVLKSLINEKRIHGAVKFLILKKREVKDVSKQSINLIHLEFIHRPIDRREFLLLLEKTIIVERYREIMKFVSKEAESRIQAFEGLININRKSVFSSDKEKQVFENILSFEKNLMREQTKLSMAIRDFTLLRHNEIFDQRKRIKAEEMLETLRRRELMDAHNIIEAQESLIDYSAHEMDDVKKTIHARENVAELSRNENIELQENLAKTVQMNIELSAEVERLLGEIELLKKN